MIEKLLDRWMLLPLAPGVELVAALLLLGVAVLIGGARHPGGSGESRASLPGVARVTSMAVIVLWVLDVAARALWVRFPTVAWWSLLLPLVVAAAGIAALLVFRRRTGTSRVGVPSMPAVRRTWRSFASGRATLAVGLVALVLVLVTIAAGSASIADDTGARVFLPLADNGVSSFYGWALGGPVLIGVALLTVASFVALSAIAARPFVSPTTVALEVEQRRISSNAVVCIAGSAFALTLGGAVQIIGQAGAAGAGDAVWATGFSAFASVFIWTGWALQVSALAALIALTIGWTPSRMPRPRSQAKPLSPSEA